MATGKPSPDDIVNGLRKELNLGKPVGEPKKSDPETDAKIDGLRQEMGLKKPTTEGQKPVVKAREIGPGDIRGAWSALEYNKDQPGGIYSAKEFRKKHQLPEDRQLTQEERDRIRKDVARILLDDANRVVAQLERYAKLKEEYTRLEKKYPESKTGVMYSHDHPIPKCVRGMQEYSRKLTENQEILKKSLNAAGTLGFTEEEIPEMKAHKALLEEKVA